MDYKEKLKLAKEALESGSYDKEIIEYIFPELKESEDERMMNQLHSWMMEFGGAEEYTEKVYQWIKGLLEKQGEQKPADKVESSAFKDKLLELFQRFRWYCKDETPTNGDIIEYVDAHIQELIDTIQKPADKVELKFKVGDLIKLSKEPKYPAREIISIKNDGYYFDSAVYLPFERQNDWELVEQKTAWSEEDVHALNTLSAMVANSRLLAKEEIFKLLDWLNSIKSRLYLQEWSEEDKRKINRIYSILRQAVDTHAFSTSCRLIGDKECIELQDFLKSLKERYTWKPSDEQMQTLYKYAEQNSYDGAVLTSLYNDIKKLK